MNNTVVYDGEMGIITKVTEGDLPYYTGATEVTPSDQTQTLYTAETIVTSNITVNPIPDMELETVEVTYTPTENEQTDTITASAGYDAIEQVNVTVEAIDSEYVGSDIPRNDDSDLTVSGATVTANAGYYAASAEATVASGTEGTPTATKGTVSGHAVSVTPSVTNSAGYISGGTHTGTAVTVSASELVSGNKAITANGTDIDVTEYATVSVAVPGDTPTLQTKSVSYTPTESAQSATVTADQGYDGLDEVNISVGAISSSYVGSAIDRRDSADLSASGATVTAPAGYYESAATKSVASGSATTPATTITANPSISVNSSTGVITATASASQSVTPTVSAGYVGSGTAGTITVSGSSTEALSTQAAATITPTDTAQTAVAANKYTTGAVTVEGVVCENLTAANIVSGVTVKVGTATDDDSVASVIGTASGDGGWTAKEIAQAEISGAIDLGAATTIKGYAFNACSGITSISAPSVLTAEHNALRNLAGLTSVSIPSITSVSSYFLADCPNLEVIHLPALTSLAGGYLGSSTINDQVAKIIVLPSLTTVSGDLFRAGTYAAIDLGPGVSSLPNRSFYGTNNMHVYSVIIFRKSDGIVAAQSDNSIANVKQNTTIYIPKALYDHLGDGTELDYRAATKWSEKTTTTFACIEGSYYETHYADGTAIPTT